MFTLTEIFAIFIIHYIADFIFQDEKWALGKSKNWNDLIAHTLTYSGIWMMVGVIFTFPYFHPEVDSSKYLFFCAKFTMIFPFITFIFHTITDYFTSRIVSKKFANKEFGSPIPNFGGFSMIGFDQVLHYVQLFLTYYLLTKH